MIVFRLFHLLHNVKASLYNVQGSPAGLEQHRFRTCLARAHEGIKSIGQKYHSSYLFSIYFKLKGGGGRRDACGQNPLHCVGTVL